MKFSLAALAVAFAATAVVADEVVYLTNCVQASGDKHSEMAYYSDISQSQNGQVPSNNNRASTNPNPFNNYVTWEGQAVKGGFPTGVTFTSHINGNGQSVGVGAYAGYGNNGKNFNCYKDNGRKLWETTGNLRCNSIYYCRPS